MNIKGNYLHLLLKRTKKEIPYHDTINAHMYPRQNQEYLNKIVNVWINDSYRFLPDDAPEYIKEGEPQIIEVPCRVIRFDAEDPWVAVYVSENYEFVVSDSSLNPSTYPLINAIQNDKTIDDIIGMKGTLRSGYIFNDNMLDTFDFDGVVIASGLFEPAVDIIIGRYSDEEFKVFLDSEVWLDLDGSIFDYENSSPILPKSKIIEVRKRVLEGKTPYGLN